MRIAALLLVAALGALARAEPVDPATLPEIPVPGGTSVVRARLFTTGSDPAVLLRALARTSFVARAGQRRVVGRIDGAPVQPDITVEIDARHAWTKDRAFALTP